MTRAAIVEAPTGPGNRDLALWREGLRHALRAATGEEPVVVRPVLAAAAAAPPQDGALVVCGATPRHLSCAVDAALRRLAPRVVHGPERGGAMLAALAARRGGVAHGGAAFVLHARGPLRFRDEERGCFPDRADVFLTEAMERRSASLAPRFVCADPAVAAWLAEQGGWPSPEPVEPLPPPPREGGAGEAGGGGLWELVLPGPLDGAEGLEFLVGALRRAAASPGPPGEGPAWRVAVLGEPGETALLDPAALVASLGAAVPWRHVEGDALAFLAAAPRRAALLGARRAAPPELLAFCGAAGVPVVARRNAALAAWGARRPGAPLDLLPEGERPFAAALAAWRGFDGGARGAPPPPADRFPDWLLPDARDAVAAGGTTPDDPARFLLRVGRARQPAPNLRARLARAARLSGAACVTCARAPGEIPLGADADTVFLDPGAALGEAVLLDAEACRAAGPAGERALAALGTDRLPAALAEAGLEALALPDAWHEPLAAPPPPPEPERFARAAGAVPPPLRDALRLVLPAAAAAAPALPGAARVAEAGWEGERLARLADLLAALGRPRAARDLRAALPPEEPAGPAAARASPPAPLGADAARAVP